MSCAISDLAATRRPVEFSRYVRLHRDGQALILKLGDGIDGGIVEHGGEGSLWLPYVEVADLMGVIERARALGAAVILDPPEGPIGWRSILSVPSGARIAPWQSKV